MFSCDTSNNLIFQGLTIRQRHIGSNMDAVLFSPGNHFTVLQIRREFNLVSSDVFSTNSSNRFSINGIVKLEIPISRVSPCFLAFQQRLHKLFNRDFIVW